MGLEAVEAIRPFGMGEAEPGVHGKQALRLEPRRAALAVAAATDEAGTLQHLEVLGDGGLRERGGLGKLDDTSLAGGQALQDGPAGGIGEGGESAAEGVVCCHN